MKNLISLLSVFILLAYASVGVAQEQSLIEPQMEVFDLFGMEPRVRGGLTARAVTLPTIRVNRIELVEGTSTTSHNHAFEQMVVVLEGSIRAISGENEFVLGPGEMFTAPSYVHHYYIALEDSVTMEVFGPGGGFTATTTTTNAP